MTEKDRAEAFKYIEAQLNDGYIDLGLHDDNELVIVKEAINLLKSLDKFNSIGCTISVFVGDGVSVATKPGVTTVGL